jgi:hypothetical protein
VLAYIDESGDPGTRGHGSRWLVLAAAMMADADKLATRAAVEQALKKAHGGRRSILHFTEMSHDDKRGCIELLKRAPWTGTIVAADTTKVHSDSRLVEPQFQYNYVARYIVERISARGTELGEPATIYFECGRHLRLSDFQQYIARLIEQGRPEIDPAVVAPGRIHQLAKKDEPLLSVADALAHAAFRALEPHRTWRHYERAYLDALIPKLWHGPMGARQSLRRWGLVLMPTALWHSEFVRDYPWLRELLDTSHEVAPSGGLDQQS